MNRKTDVPRNVVPYRDTAVIMPIISEVTGRPHEQVERLLAEEYRTPGVTVAAELSRRGIEPYVHSPKMDAFYAESDAFLFESVIWNRNRLKRRMRLFTAKRLTMHWETLRKPDYDVLVIGDGPGFDSVEFARAGCNVTYHEFPGYQEQFARRFFEACGQSVRIITERERIPKAAFDAVVCLDVLEHVNDPPAVVKSLLEHLRPGGIFIAHAPFYMIHPAYPTHLRSNRKHSGSLAPYMDAGLRLVDGSITWNPLVFQRAGEVDPWMGASALRLLAIHAVGAYIALGRRTVVPLIPVHWMRLARGRWFPVSTPP